MIKNNSNFVLNQQIADKNRRYLILVITIDDKKWVLVNCYAPNEDDPKFFYDLISEIENFQDNDHIIIGGILT